MDPIQTPHDPIRGPLTHMGSGLTPHHKAHTTSEWAAPPARSRSNKDREMLQLPFLVCMWKGLVVSMMGSHRSLADNKHTSHSRLESLC
jgi:hypothetical protein